MKQNRVVSSFGRVVSALKGEAKELYALDAKNVRMDGFKIAPRYGYANVAAKPGLPTDTFQSLGLGYVLNRSGLLEILSVENRNGVTNLYKIDPTTYTRTVIGGALNPTRWQITHFGNDAYLINPGGTKTVYKHVIGDNSSLVAIEDTAYTPPPTNPALSIAAPSYQFYNFASPDAVAITSDGISGAATVVFNAGKIEVSGTQGGGGQFQTATVEVLFGTAQNWADRAYIGIETLSNAGVGFQFLFNNNMQVEIRTGGTWKTCETKDRSNPQTFVQKLMLIARIKGIAGINAVQGIRYRFRSEGQAPAGNVLLFRVSNLYLGGQLIEAPLATDRVWSPPVGDGVQYAARYFDPTSVNAPTAVSQNSITKEAALGTPLAIYQDLSLGGRPTLSVESKNQATHSRVQFLRLAQDGVTWKELAQVNNTGTTVTFIDTKEENEIGALPTVTLTGVNPVDPKPPFRTKGIRGAFPFKNSMVWLVNDGISNIQISEVGAPESLYDPAITYNATSKTVPAQLTMADNSSDIPVWGTQLGLIAIVLGKYGAYSFAGDFPSEVTPSRLIPGSRGVAGMDAACRYKDAKNGYSVAYADKDGNVWLVYGYPRFGDDASVKPYELSGAVRGRIKSFLVDEQLAEYPSISLENALMEFDEVNSSLWLILGRRACIYRQGTGNDGWDFHEYALATPPGTTTVTTCSPPSHVGALSSSVAPGVAWSVLGFAFGSDDDWGMSGPLPLGTGSVTATLRSDSFGLPSAIPASATITSAKFYVERSKQGDLQVTETTVQPRKAGVSFGAALGTNTVLAETDTTQVFTLATLPTVAEINLGAMGLDLKYTQENSNPDWNDPSKWTFTPTNGSALVAGSSATCNARITATYSGAAPAPPFVKVNATIWSSIQPGYAGVPPTPVTNYSGTGTISNGIGGSITMPIAAPAFNDELPNASVTTSGIVRIPLVSGTGFLDIPATGSLSVTGTPRDSSIASIPSALSLNQFVPSTVRVDNIDLEICYQVTNTVPASSYGQSWQSAFFFAGDTLAVRSTGALDMIERLKGSYVAGVNRDGGYKMPSAFWLSQDVSFDSRYAQLFQVQVHSENKNPIKVCAYSDVASVQVGTLPMTGSRWRRFGLNMQGIRFNVRMDLEETDGYISGLTMEYAVKSRGIRE